MILNEINKVFKTLKDVAHDLSLVLIKLPIERVTSAFAIINNDHALIHAERGFKAHIELATLPGTVEYLIRTPVDEYPHFKNLRLMALGGTVRGTIIRGATITADGNAPGAELIGPNNLSDSPTAPETGMVITKTPTYSGGTVWELLKVLGDATNQYTSVAETKSSPDEELLMWANSAYILKLEKIGLDTPTNVTVTMFWYEEEYA